MEEGKEYTIQDFCNLLNLKPSRTKELLKALTQDIEQIGNNKNRKYRLNGEETYKCNQHIFIYI